MKIVRYPHPALRFPARPVPLIDNDIRRLVGQMIDLMLEHHGLGLAAPQVALPYQIFVWRPGGEPEQPPGQERVFINPVISDRKGSVEADEGCLSFPGLYQKVRRAKSIRVQAYDQHGAAIDEALSDLPARIVQHETDHLHGRLYIDLFGPVAKVASRKDIAVFERDFRKEQERGLVRSNREILRQLRALEKEIDQCGKPPPPEAAVM